MLFRDTIAATHISDPMSFVLSQNISVPIYYKNDKSYYQQDVSHSSTLLSAQYSHRPLSKSCPCTLNISATECKQRTSPKSVPTHLFQQSILLK